MSSRSSRRSREPQQEDANLTVQKTDNNAPTPDYHFFEGVAYPSYQDMVVAKRKRNHQVFVDSGLADAVEDMKATSRLLTKKKRAASIPKPALPRRSSNRIKGIGSDGRYVEDERSGRFSIAGTGTEGSIAVDQSDGMKANVETFFRNRINAGEDVSIQQAIERAGGTAEEATQAESFVQTLAIPFGQTSNKSPNSVVLAPSPNNKLDDMRVEAVAKMTRDRIYGIATHPSTDQLVIAAGDKQGNIGIWNVDAPADEPNDGLYEFRYHNGAVNNLQFTSHNSLLSTSYDGTVRLFDLEKQCARQVFATYDDSSEFKDKLGYGLDTGYNFWTQYMCLDHRANDGLAFFLSTSTGFVYHVDLRANQLTFTKQLSEKKINTVSLHPNGHSLLTAGLDGDVSLWDIRRLATKQKPARIAAFSSGRSVNSAFFSPSGAHVVSTTMANKLDIFHNLHLAATDDDTIQPAHRIAHDNKTGRWLTTFMATWHPSLDIFCVGSMRRPREIQIFDTTGSMLRSITGDDLTAVASRCCFHYASSSTESRLTVVGGNSSGRVTVAR
jgi:WD40 repeat protein